MKKILLAMLLLFMVTLASCNSEPDYYTKAEFDMMIEELDQEYNYYHEELSELRDEVWEAREEIEVFNTESQMQRFFIAMMESELLGNSSTFAEVGETITGSVSSWGYGFIIVELSESIDVEIKATLVAPDNEWNLNVYNLGTDAGKLKAIYRFQQCK